MIRRLESIGASAKITGAGGVKSGSGMVIVYHPDTEKLVDLARKMRLNLIEISLGQDGVKF